MRAGAARAQLLLASTTMLVDRLTSQPRNLREPSFVARSEAGVTRVVDNDDGHVSVTNAAEVVVGMVLQVWPGQPIVYRDSRGIWDQLVHDGSRFVGFRALGASDEAEAVIQCLARERI